MAHVFTSPPECLAPTASPDDSSDSALLFLNILSVHKILPSCWPINFLLTMRVTYFHNVEKDYSAADSLLPVSPTPISSNNSSPGAGDSVPEAWL